MKKVKAVATLDRLRTMISAIRNSTHLGVRIHAAPSTAEQKPMNLAFLMDTSDSMSGDRLESVKRTLHAARGLFLPNDQVSLVAFGEDAVVVTAHLALDAAGTTQFYVKINAITTNGCTNLSAGIEALLTLQLGKPPLDAVVILTDGIVNRGIISTVGLRTMCAGLGAAPITALGYGADHNRLLLRDLALGSRGAYVYVDSESLLPIAMGDLVSGIRSEVVKHAVIEVPAGWTCCELGSSGHSFALGNIVSSRDYWVVFQKSHDADLDGGPITLSSGHDELEQLRHVLISDCQELHEQVLRCRVVKAIASASDQMEQFCYTAHSAELLALKAEFDALPELMQARPLIVRMKAQLAEILEQPIRHAAPPDLMARMTSGTAYLGTQRGVSHQTADPADQVFSSPCQRATSQQMQVDYESTTPVQRM